VSQGLEPFRQAARLLSTIPGVSEVSAKNNRLDRYSRSRGILL